MIDDTNISEEERQELNRQATLDALRKSGPNVDEEGNRGETTVEAGIREHKEETAEAKANTNEDGSLKSTWQQKDASEFGAKENLEDAGRAVVTGLQNVWNNTIDLGKYADPAFYSQKNKEAPDYEFASQWKFNNQLMPKTRWGGFIRDVTDFGVGMIGVGKIGMGIKGIRGFMLAGKTVDKAGKMTNLAGKANMAKRLGVDAVKGAVVDVWDTSMATSEAFAEGFIKDNPVLAENLFGLEDGRDFSPAQRAGLNMFESMGIGSVFGAALEGTGNLFRRYQEVPKTKVTKPGLELAEEASTVSNTLKEQEIESISKLTADLTRSTRVKYEADTFKALKKSGALPDDMNMAQFRSIKGDLPNGKKKWDQLEEPMRWAMMEDNARAKGIDWGEIRDYSLSNTKQGKQVLEIGARQLEIDLNAGQPRKGAYYAADKTEYQNQPLSTGDPDPMKSVRDTISINTNIGSRRGSPRGVVTNAQIKRMAEPGGITVDELKKITTALTENEEFINLYKGKSKDEILDNFVYAANELQEFLGPAGRVTDYSYEQLVDFVRAFDDGRSIRYPGLTPEDGFDALTASQVQMTDVVLTQLSKEMRDISRGVLSIENVVDSRIPGGAFDEVADRFKALQQLRMQSTSLTSGALRDLGTGSPSSAKILREAAETASKKAQQQLDLMIEVLRKDNDGLYDAFLYFSAASNGSKLTMNDMADFFAKKLGGGEIGNKVERNKIVNEMMTMGINSMLSGPKTPVRAIIGTGINTVMRPASVIVGTAFPGGDRRTKMAAFAELGGMIDGLSESWRKAVSDYKTYFDNGGNFRDYTNLNSVDEFDAIKGYVAANGTTGEKIQFNTYAFMRGLNVNPFLSYGPRIMKAADSFFGQLIYRGHKRAEAFLEVYDRMQDAGGALGDFEMKAAIREAEARFNKKVWKANGSLSDDYANFKWKEATLTGEMPKWGEKVQEVTEGLPLIKPFVGLFMRTGVNALTLTTKYTPILNRLLQESKDIMNPLLKPGDPQLLKYGITTADQLAEARAVRKGREAIGFGFVALASSLYLGGNLSGNGPPDIRQRKAWEQSGKWQARSIKIGDKWVSYESLEPFNAVLAMVADIGDMQGPMGEQWTEDQYALLGHLISKNVSNKTFLSGLMDLNDLITGKGRSVEAIAADLLNNQIPLSSMRNDIGKLINPGMRELEYSFAEQIKNRNLYTEILFPGDEGDLPYRYDIFTGEPLRDWDPMTRILNFVLPFNINTTGSQTRDYLMRSGVNFNQTFTTGPGDVSLEGEPRLISKFQKYLSEEGLEARFTKLFATKPEIINSIIQMERDHSMGIQTLSPSDTVHGVLIRREFDKAKKSAWVRLRNENKEIDDLIRIQANKKLEEKARREGRYKDAAKYDEAQKILQLKIR